MDGNTATPAVPLDNDLDTRHRRTQWHDTVPVPIRHFGLPRQNVRLPLRVPDTVVLAACNLFTTFHATACRWCTVLIPLHRLLHPLLPRTALVLTVLASSVTAAAATGNAPIPQLPTHAAVAALLVHAAWALGVFTAALHRRHMPTEMALRVHTARCHLVRPHP